MAASQRHDCAVAFCCDRNYYHLALFMIRQIAFHNPHRRFDFVVSSRDDLEVPDWAKPLGIVLHRTGDLPHFVEAVRYRGSVAPLYRINLSRELGDRYRRIVYLDSDMFVEGGDLNRLLEIDMGSYPIAAVLDAPFLYQADYRSREYTQLNWPAAPYANTGMQVIDTRAYIEQEVDHRAFAVVQSHPNAVVYTDQSLTNITLRGKFAQLAPCWNWQWNYRFPLLPLHYPVFLRHFIGPMKPDRDSSGLMDVRFNQAYREFLTQLMPELLPKLAPACDPVPMRLKQYVKIGLRHLAARNLMVDLLARFPDPYKARL
jgi:hypothetical protein